MKARLIAFYLPQFHPISENDEWWGRGFTEWTNVVKAKPLFRGHHQPHLPGELGFYDLRVPEVREAQAELARTHGIEGFCYWHYWFHGRRLLERPFNEVLKSGRPNFPFCLAWANESWDRCWSGRQDEVLIEQKYSDADDLGHIRWLADAFADARYIKVNRRPLFLVYRPDLLPDAKRTTDVWRCECVRLGLPEPYLVGINQWMRRDVDLRTLGFDMTEHHAPDLHALPEFDNNDLSLARLLRNLSQGVPARWKKLYRYERALELMARNRPTFPHIPCFFVGWDTSPRHGGRAVIMTGATPQAVARGLSEMIGSVQASSPEERIVFINAWNEWGEGMYLEPDARWGRDFLQAVAGVLVPQRTE